jgi:hypothetical protein
LENLASQPAGANHEDLALRQDILWSGYTSARPTWPTTNSGAVQGPRLSRIMVV